MKRIIFSASLFIALSGAMAFAQTTTPPDSSPAPNQQGHHRGGHWAHNPQQEAAFLSKKLNLTSEQQSQLEPILANRDQQMKTLRSDTSLSKDQKRTQFQTIQQNTMQQLSTVLTPDQLQQMKSMHHHRGGQRPSQSQSPSSAPSGL